MTDTTDLTAKYECYDRMLAECNLFNRKEVFEALAALRIDTVIVDFNGESDSGQIENLLALSGENPRSLTDTHIEIRHVHWGADSHESIQTRLDDAVEELCYNFLGETNEGWENDDGAFGNFTFNVAERSIELDFNARFSSSVNHTYTF